MGEYELTGLLPGGSSAVFLCSSTGDDQRWAMAELKVTELIRRLQPSKSSEERRKDVTEYVKRLIHGYSECYVFPFGSLPLKTYLPDGDIDLTAFSLHQHRSDLWAKDLCSILENEERRDGAQFTVKEVQCIHAEVQIVKCLVEDIIVDISFNQLGGLCTLCFLEEVDQLIGKNHLFKRSIILVKAWCYYESRILGAHHGLISTYALETLVLYIFHVFPYSLHGPLEVLFRFLEFFSNFDWEHYCLSLHGPIPISALPDMASHPPRRDGGQGLLSHAFLDACGKAYAVLPGGQEMPGKNFSPKFLNIVDPLRTNNNLGRSVNKGNFCRIRRAFNLGAKQLEKIMCGPEEDLVESLRICFLNIENHCSENRLDIPAPNIQHAPAVDAEKQTKDINDQVTNLLKLVGNKTESCPKQSKTDGVGMQKLSEDQISSLLMPLGHSNRSKEVTALAADVISTCEFSSSMSNINKVMDTSQSGEANIENSCVAASGNTLLVGRKGRGAQAEVTGGQDQRIRMELEDDKPDLLNSRGQLDSTRGMAIDQLSSKFTGASFNLLESASSSHISIRNIGDLRIESGLDSSYAYEEQLTMEVNDSNDFQETPFHEAAAENGALSRSVDGNISKIDEENPLFPVVDQLKRNERCVSPCSNHFPETSVIQSFLPLTGCKTASSGIDTSHQDEYGVLLRFIDGNVSDRDEESRLFPAGGQLKGNERCISPCSNKFPEMSVIEPSLPLAGCETAFLGVDTSCLTHALNKVPKVSLETDAFNLSGSLIKALHSSEPFTQGSVSAHTCSCATSAMCQQHIVGKVVAKGVPTTCQCKSEEDEENHQDGGKHLEQDCTSDSRSNVSKQPVCEAVTQLITTVKTLMSPIISSSFSTTNSLSSLTDVQTESMGKSCGVYLLPIKNVSTCSHAEEISVLSDRMEMESGSHINLEEGMKQELLNGGKCSEGSMLDCFENCEEISSFCGSSDFERDEETEPSFLRKVLDFSFIMDRVDIAHSSEVEIAASLISEKENLTDCKFQLDWKCSSQANGDLRNYVETSKTQAVMLDVDETLPPVHVPNTGASLDSSADLGDLEGDGIKDFRVDILVGDLSTYLHNLEVGRYCQCLHMHGPLLFLSPGLGAPKYIQGHYPGPGRPTMTNMNIFMNMPNYGLGILPDSLLHGANMQQTFALLNSFMGEDAPRFHRGTGTYLPNLRPGFYKDRQRTGSGRGHHGTNGFDYCDFNSHEGTHAFTPRYHAIGHSQRKNDLRSHGKHNRRLLKNSVEGKSGERFQDILPQERLKRNTLHGFLANSSSTLDNHPTCHPDKQTDSSFSSIPEELEFGSVPFRIGQNGSGKAAASAIERTKYTFGNHNATKLGECTKFSSKISRKSSYHNHQLSPAQSSYQLKEEDFPPLSCGHHGGSRTFNVQRSNTNQESHYQPCVVGSMT